MSAVHQRRERFPSRRLCSLAGQKKAKEVPPAEDSSAISGYYPFLEQPDLFQAGQCAASALCLGGGD